MFLRTNNGYSLVELLLVILIIGIASSLAIMGNDIVKKNKLTSASKGLYADLVKLRMDAMTRSTVATTKGFGVNLTSSNAYYTFEFTDTDNDFSYDAGEEAGAISKSMPDVAVTVQNATGNADLLFFDKRGMARSSSATAAQNWISGSRVFVITLPSIADRRCVEISDVRIREGTWNGISCKPS